MWYFKILPNAAISTSMDTQYKPCVRNYLDMALLLEQIHAPHHYAHLVYPVHHFLHIQYPIISILINVYNNTDTLNT